LSGELEAVGGDPKARANVLAVANAKLADIDRRSEDARKTAALDLIQIRRDGDRAAVEFDAKEREREGRISPSVGGRWTRSSPSARRSLMRRATRTAP